MSIKLTISNTVQVKVKGKIADDAGRDQPFDFVLVCKRLDADELKALMDNQDTPVSDIVRKVTEDWRGVLDDDNQPMPFTGDGLDQLLRIPGLALIAMKSYFAEVGAKEKN